MNSTIDSEEPIVAPRAPEINTEAIITETILAIESMKSRRTLTAKNCSSGAIRATMIKFDIVIICIFQNCYN